VLAVTAGLFGTGYAVVRLRRRRATMTARNGGNSSVVLASQGAGFYVRYLDIVHRLLDLHPEPGQTPHEFALTARRQLAARGLGDCVAIPLALVDLLYRVRFGARVLTAAEELDANNHVE